MSVVADWYDAEYGEHGCCIVGNVPPKGDSHANPWGFPMALCGVYLDLPKWDDVLVPLSPNTRPSCDECRWRLWRRDAERMASKYADKIKEAKA